MARDVIRGRVDPADRERDRYLLVPFEVPEGSRRIEVQLRYDAGNVLDLGAADPRFGTFPASEGFRGWSGGFRDRFAIEEGAATPGYLPGPLPAGRWHALLGLHRVRPGGCAFEIEVRIDEPATAPLLPLPRESGAPPPFAPGWAPGDLHAHTHHSDAPGSLEDLVRAAEARGLAFLAVTDHNTVSHHPHLAAMQERTRVLLVPGQEATTDDGHANVWGARGWVDFRFQHSEHVAAFAERARGLGAVVSVNHPKEGGPTWRYDVPAAAAAVEVWQAPWANRNWESLARYDRLLAGGRRLTLVGGSDRHQPGWPESDPVELRIGSPTTWLHLEEPGVPGVLEAIRRGRAFVSESPAGPRLEIEVDGSPMGHALAGSSGRTARARVRGASGQILRWMGAGGELRQVPIDGEEFEDAWTLTDGERFVRAEVVAAGDDRAARLERIGGAIGSGRAPRNLTLAAVEAHPLRLALSNPVFFGT